MQLVTPQHCQTHTHTHTHTHTNTHTHTHTHTLSHTHTHARTHARTLTHTHTHTLTLTHTHTHTRTHIRTHAHAHQQKPDKPRLTLADELQRWQKIIVTHDGHGQKHVEDDHEVNQNPSVLPLLNREESFRKFRRLRRDAVRHIF